MLLVINKYYNKDNFLTAIVAQPDVKAGISEQKGQAVIGTRHHLAEFILNIMNIKDIPYYGMSKKSSCQIYPQISKSNNCHHATTYLW